MSAVDDLRKTVLAGGDAAGVSLRAIIELADRVVALEARVFPPEPASTDAAVVAAQPITTDRPQLTGTYEAPTGGEPSLEPSSEG